MSDRIQSITAGKKINILLFADSGWGKTRTIGTTPGKVLILRPPQDHTDAILPADKNRVKEWVLRDWDDIWESMEYVRHEGHKWDFVWLDNISILQDVGLDDIWDTVIKEKPARKRYGLDKQEYGINMFRLGQYIRHIVGAEIVNFGITAHPAELAWSEDEDAEEKLMPWIQGKNMSPKICGYMNVIAYGDYTDKGTRRLNFAASEKHYAKDQYDAFLPKNQLLIKSPGTGAMATILGAIEKKRPAKKAAASKKRRASATTRSRKSTRKGR